MSFLHHPGLKEGQCIAQLQLASWKPEVFHSPWLWWAGKTIPRKSRASSNTYFPPSFIYQTLYKAILEKQGKPIEQKQDLCWQGWSSLSVVGYVTRAPGRGLGDCSAPGRGAGNPCLEKACSKMMHFSVFWNDIMASAKPLFAIQTQKVSPKG